MDEKNVSYLAFESSQARMERVNRRQFIIILVLIAVVLFTNAGWIYYESQYEDVVVTQEATADGSSDIHLQNIGGDVYGGESKTDG